MNRKTKKKTKTIKFSTDVVVILLFEKASCIISFPTDSVM